MDKEQFVKETKAHAQDVSRLINYLCNEAMQRGRKHDHSKFDHIDDYVAFLTAKEKKENTDKYYHVYLEHCKEENHHPQKIQNDSCDLLDIMEMLCDWVSASAQRDTILDPKETRLPHLNWDKILRNTLTDIVNHYGNSKQAFKSKEVKENDG